MIPGETSRIVRLLVIVLFGTLLGDSATAQETSASVQSANSLAKNLKPNVLAHTGVQIVPFHSNPFVRSLAKNQHALMSAPPQGIASALTNTNANLSSTSLRRFSLPGVSRTDFLAGTRVEPAAWKRFDTPAVNASELRSNKHPNLARPE